VAKILVAIPAFNESPTLRGVIDQVKTLCLLREADVLVVDDGSMDETAQVAIRAGAVVVSHQTNLGVGAAFSTATSYAMNNAYDFMLTVDADGQFPIESISSVLDHGLATGRFTSGSRFLTKASRRSVPLVRRLGNMGLAWLVSYLAKQKFTDVSCGLRLYPRDSLNFVALPGGFTYTQSSLLDMAFRKIERQEVAIEVQYFRDRQSTVSGNLLSYATRAGMILWSAAKIYFPNRVFLPISLVSSGIGAALSLMFLMNFLVTSKFSGFLFAGFLGGFMITLGLLLLGVSLILTSLTEIRLDLHIKVSRK